VEGLNFATKALLLVFCWFVAAFPAVLVGASDTVVETTVFVYPSELTVAVNETFQVFVNVSSAFKLQGFDFMLTYDSAILNCSSLVEGTFLSEFGPTFVAKSDVNNSFTSGHGRVWFAAVIYGTGFADGNGTLAVLTFKALSTGRSVLNLFSDNPVREDAVKLTTCLGKVIQNHAVDGSVVVVEGSGDPVDPLSDTGGSLQSGLANVDVNDDGVVDMRDMAIVAAAYRASSSDVRYDVKADLNHDGQVDIVDLALVARNFMDEA
jgi:hypothetical protein